MVICDSRFVRPLEGGGLSSELLTLPITFRYSTAINRNQIDVEGKGKLEIEFPAFAHFLADKVAVTIVN